MDAYSGAFFVISVANTSQKIYLNTFDIPDSVYLYKFINYIVLHFNKSRVGRQTWRQTKIESIPFVK